MLRRRLPSSFCTTTASSCLSCSSRRFSSSSGRNNNNDNGDDLSSLIDPRLVNVSNFLAQPKGERETDLVILVDATALLYRTAYNWASLMAGKGAFEADPSTFLQARLPRILQFCHSVIPIGDGSEQFQPPLLPPEVAIDAANLDFLQPIGGPWQNVEQYKVAMAMRMEKEKKMKMMKDEISSRDQDDDDDLVSADLSSGRGSSSIIDIEKMNSQALNTSKVHIPLMFAETKDSPGFFRRRVIFCFDHGSKKYRRSDYIDNYKGQRPSCGRISSFLGYSSAIVRQLETVGLIQGIFPSDLPPVLHDHKTHINTDEKFRSILNRFSDLMNDDVGQKKNASPGAGTVHLSEKAKELFPGDIVKQSLFDGATIASPKHSSSFAEGDDILHTCVKHFSEVEKVPTLVVTHDKDLLQLLEYPKTYFFHLKQNSFISRRQTCEDYGITSPKNLEDYLVLCGDVSDNIPGLPETGVNRAKALLHTFGTIEKLVEVSKKKVAGELKKMKPEDVDIAADDYLSKIHVPGALNKKGLKRRISAKYLQNLYFSVAQHSERLLRNKEHVIRLQQVPEVEKFLENGMKSDVNAFSDPVSFPDIPTHFFTSGVFRRNLKAVIEKDKQLAEAYLTAQQQKNSSNTDDSTMKDQKGKTDETNRSQETNGDRTQVASSRPSTGPLANAGVFRAIRQYYIDTMGPCDETNEKQHSCGDAFGLNSKKSKMIKEWEDKKVEQKKQSLIQEFEENRKKHREQKMKDNSGNEGGEGKKKNKNQTSTTKGKEKEKEEKNTKQKNKKSVSSSKKLIKKVVKSLTSKSKVAKTSTSKKKSKK